MAIMNKTHQVSAVEFDLVTARGREGSDIDVALNAGAAARNSHMDGMKSAQNHIDSLAARQNPTSHER